MELEDIFPEKPEFTLAGSSYTFRLPTLDDKIWFGARFDKDRYRLAFKNRDWEILSVMAMRLLTDRSNFAAVVKKDQIDEEGQTVNITVSGPQIFRERIQTIEDELNVIKALGSAFTYSDPVITKAIREEVKKSLLAIGEASSTNSQPSTDGAPSTSLAEL